MLQASLIRFLSMRVDNRRLKACAEQNLLFDAHCHYLNYRQQTEGLNELKKAMDKGKVGFAVLTGTPFKKTWIDQTQAAPQHHLHDDGDLYNFSMTDGFLIADMRRAQATASMNGDDDFVHHFGVTVCGFNLADFGVRAEAERMLDTYPAFGIGEMTLQSDDLNNMTIKGGNWTYAQPSVNQLLHVCANQPFPRKSIPFVFLSDARSISTKPYRKDFEYLDQVEAVLSQQPTVKCLWVGGGVFMRGQWKEYSQQIEALLKKYSNL